MTITVEGEMLNIVLQRKWDVIRWYLWPPYRNHMRRYTRFLNHLATTKGLYEGTLKLLKDRATYGTNVVKVDWKEGST